MYAHCWRTVGELGSCCHVHSFEHPCEVTITALRGGDLATACRDGVLRCWELSSGTLSRSHAAHCTEGASTDVFGLVWLDAHTLLSGGADRTLQRWCNATGARVDILRGTSACSTLAIDAELGLVAAPQRDRSVALLEAPTLRTARRLVGFPRPVLTAAIGGGRVACAGMGGCIFVWDARSGGLLHSLEHAASATYALALLGGELLLSGACGETCVRVWHMRRGATVGRLHRPSGGKGSMCALAVHGRVVLGGDNASSVPQIWQAHVCHSK